MANKPRYAVYLVTERGEELYRDKNEEGKPMDEYAAELRKTYLLNSKKGKRLKLNLITKKINKAA